MMEIKDCTENEREIDMLQQIHRLATNNDWMTVPFKIDEFEMAELKIEKAEKVFMHIADLAQVGLGD